MKLLEELQYLKMFFKHSYDDVFFSNNEIMKTGEKRKLSSTVKNSKFLARGFEDYQFLRPTLRYSL